MGLICLLIALQVAGIATTLYFLKHNLLTEGNPILRWFFDRIGPVPTLLIGKGAFIVFVCHHREAIPRSFLAAFFVPCAAAVVWNVVQIRKAK